VTIPSTSLDSDDDIHISNLTLEQVTLEDIGEYTCTAENEGGEMSDMINVDVYGKNIFVILHVCYVHVSLPVFSFFQCICLFACFFFLFDAMTIESFNLLSITLKYLVVKMEQA